MRIDQSARGRQLEREGEEEQPRVTEHPEVPGLFLERVEVDVPGEELVRLERVPREEPLEVRLGQTARDRSRKTGRRSAVAAEGLSWVSRDLRSSH